MLRDTLHLLSYNIRKGKGAAGRAGIYPETGAHTDKIPAALEPHQPDIVLCQEVFHAHDDPSDDQTGVLAHGLDMKAYYAPNKIRRIGHHGNATFTQWPVDRVQNYDLSQNRVEKRGALYTRVQSADRPVHVFNVHLSLTARQRRAQMNTIAELLRDICPEDEPVVIAGDFNDWNRQIDAFVTNVLGLRNAFEGSADLHRETWHVRYPVFNVDRVYVRHLDTVEARRLDGAPWNHLSDHYPLSVRLRLLP